MTQEIGTQIKMGSGELPDENVEMKIRREALATLEEILMEMNTDLSLFQLVRISEILEARGFPVPDSIHEEISYMCQEFEKEMLEAVELPFEVVK